MRYAMNTDVPVDRKYGATSFVSGWDASAMTIMFEMKNRRLRFRMQSPTLQQHLTTAKGRKRDEALAKAAMEQAIRQQWRALGLVIKAKLEAVESEIATFDDEFLAYFVTASGHTVSELMENHLERALSSGKMPPLLPAPKQGSE